MKNLNEFSKLLFSEKNNYERKKATLQSRLEKVEFDLALLKRKKPKPKGVIKPLALAIQKELKAKAYYVVDISSLWSTVIIHWVTEADMTKCKNKDHIAKLEIDRYDNKWVIIEKDKYGEKQYLDMHKNKGVRWLAKYARQKLLDEGVYGD